MTTDELTAAEVRQIAAEIDAWGVGLDRHPEDWRVYWIAHLYALRQECYLVMYENGDRKSTRLNSSHQIISYAVFCLKKKKEWTRSREGSPNSLRERHPPSTTSL